MGRRVIPTEILVKRPVDEIRGDSAKKARQNKRDSDCFAKTLSDDAPFDAEVVRTVGDLPPPWLYALYRKHSDTAITDEMITGLCKKSPLRTKRINTCLTGRSPGAV